MPKQHIIPSLPFYTSSPCRVSRGHSWAQPGPASTHTCKHPPTALTLRPPTNSTGLAPLAPWHWGLWNSTRRTRMLPFSLHRVKPPVFLVFQVGLYQYITAFLITWIHFFKNTNTKILSSSTSRSVWSPFIAATCCMKIPATKFSPAPAVPRNWVPKIHTTWSPRLLPAVSPRANCCQK